METVAQGSVRTRNASAVIAAVQARPGSSRADISDAPQCSPAPGPALGWRGWVTEAPDEVSRGAGSLPCDAFRP